MVDREAAKATPLAASRFLAAGLKPR
jgi:hypothetical protein